VEVNKENLIVKIDETGAFNVSIVLDNNL